MSRNMHPTAVRGAQGCLLALVAFLLATPVTAGDLDLQPGLTPGEFEALVEHLAEAVEMPTGPAKALGLVGFELQGGTFWVNADDSAGWWRHSLSGVSNAIGGLSGVRAGVRKGLPGGVDVGLSGGAVAGETFFSAEARMQLVSPDVFRPAVGIRAVWSELTSGPVDLSVYSAGLTASKGFPLVTPYASLGLRRVEGEASWGEPEPVRHDVGSTTFTAAAGVAFSLPPLGLRVELRHGHATAGFLGLGLRF